MLERFDSSRRVTIVGPSNTIICLAENIANLLAINNIDLSKDYFPIKVTLRGWQN